MSMVGKVAEAAAKILDMHDYGYSTYYNFRRVAGQAELKDPLWEKLV